jgi:hypothetical protein
MGYFNRAMVQFQNAEMIEKSYKNIDFNNLSDEDWVKYNNYRI